MFYNSSHVRKRRSSKKFPDGINRVINNLVPEGKAFGYHLAGPEREDALLDDFVTLIFSRENGSLLLRPVTRRGSKAKDIYKKILDLGSPDKFNEIEVSVEDDVKRDVRLECVTKNTPFAVLALGKTKKSKTDLAVLFVVAGVPPKDVHKAICEGANKVIKALNESEPPPTICG